MSSNFPMVPAGIPLPSVPQSNGELLGWASGITRAIQHLNRVMSSRLFDVLLQGVDASKPTANGSLRFYWATDTNTLYYDIGTSWVAVGSSAASEVHPYATGSFTIPTGYFVVQSKMIQLTGSQSVAVQGTGQRRIT